MKLVVIGTLGRVHSELSQEALPWTATRGRPGFGN
jgi:hypothetical protein